jgi:glutaminyl-peptide cyclotransferase
MKRLLVAFALLAIGVLFVLPFLRPRTGEPVDGQERKRTGFAQDRVPPMLPKGDEKPAPFDGKRAMGYLQDICAIGPRMSGTPGMKKQQELLKKHFEDLGLEVDFQTFQAKQNSQSKPVEMTNLVVSFYPDFPRRVILCCHYDTRPIADQEPDPRKWREPFLSANDGGSGVAFLMEMAHHVKALKPKVGVDFVIFDGEEYIFEARRDKYFFGSQHFVQKWKKKKDRPEYVGAVLLDMIAGKKARFPAEGYSFNRANQLVRDIWAIAEEQ